MCQQHRPPQTYSEQASKAEKNSNLLLLHRAAMASSDEHEAAECFVACAGAKCEDAEEPDSDRYDEPLLIVDKYISRVLKHCKRLKTLQGDPRAGHLHNLASLQAYYKDTKAGFKEDLNELSLLKDEYRYTMENLEKWLFLKQYVTSKDEVFLLAVKDIAVISVNKFLESESGLQRLKQLVKNRRIDVPPEERRSYIMGMVPQKGGDPSKLTTEERQEVALRSELGNVGPVRRQRIVSTPN